MTMLVDFRRTVTYYNVRSAATRSRSITAYLNSFVQLFVPPQERAI